MNVPRWFEKELKVINPNYYVTRNNAWRNGGIWEIRLKKDFERSEIVQGKEIQDFEEVIQLHAKNPVMAVFEKLDNLALHELRRRRYLQLKYGSTEIEEIEKRSQQVKEAAGRLSTEMITDGFMKVHRQQMTHQVDMGANA
jgi:hypothetical protein